MSDVIIGLDLGQASDPTALAVLRRKMPLAEDGTPATDDRGQPLVSIDCVHLTRFPLGTSYPDVVARVKRLVDQPELQPGPRLAVDATGVGRAVVDMFLEAGLAAEIYPITLTSGSTARREQWNRSGAMAYWTPKNATIGVAHVLLQTGRLKIAQGLRLAEVFRQELLDYRGKINRATAYTSFGARSGRHDDILLAVAIGCWLGMRAEITYRPDDPSGASNVALAKERS